MEFETVPGTDRGDLKLYALSTCVWCKKTKKLLDELGVKYAYVFVDKLEGASKQSARDEVKRWNPACSFPTLVIDNHRCIVGFKEHEIKEALGSA